MSAQPNVAPIIIKRKKVVGGDGHHGGAWKVAYADFVTVMMAFFLLMWLLNATTEKQRMGLADYFAPSVPIHRISSGSENPFGGENVFSQETLINSGTGGSEDSTKPGDPAKGIDASQKGGSFGGRTESDAIDQLKEIEEELFGRGGESMVADNSMKHIITRVTDEGLVIEIFAREGAPLFDEGTADPTPLYRELVEMIARRTMDLPHGVAVNGFVRANPVVAAENPVWALSGNRAERTRGLLELFGTRSERIKRITGHADRKPADDNPMAVRNDRVEITILRKEH
ncbi:chemotaxis protein MotB [Sulfitobacter sp. BDSS02]|nr:chemotaxis protein MotB [Sulfitobacter sp. BDSS02]MBR9851286.1 chemotaxis protein MotB [Paracoccaceae bacterium]